MKRVIAFVCAYYPPKIGGVENYVARIARAVGEEADLEPVVITTRESGWRTSVGTEDGVLVVRLGVLLRLSNSPISPLWPIQVRRWLRRTGAQIVNAHAPVPGLADTAMAVAGKRRTVLTYHAGTMHKGEPGSGLADWIIARYERHVLPRVLRSADVAVPVGPSSLAAERPDAVLITPGVDLERFVPGPAPSQRPRDLVYVGRIDRTSAWKGIDVLLRAMTLLRDLPDVRLRLVGSGDALPDHLRLAGELGVADRVEATGALHGAELVEAMRHAAVLVLPSTSHAECAGTVLMEGMACATPLVASDVGSLAYVVQDGEAGLIVPPGDVEALAAACRRLLVDDELADRMGKAGRARAEARFAWPLLARTYIDLFRSL
ncbi:glycosyltransferase family 4 protein [Actinospica robiniae]|uniref:glycosyltransferase family 4 protein n=1 Tax=Actinospica robiniae TaxID=304901 RepID=UPI0004297DF8|nr:glycosyltransferase family 4 protein [Actinospica robiniae]